MKVVMVRLDERLRDRLKIYASVEGRTLEWCMNKAVQDFIETDGGRDILGTVDLPTRETTRIEEVSMAQVTSLERACCIAAKPCQHWTFTGDVWRNSLSGRIREADV